jgi:uncharacterized membrane protein (DUF106 family)
MFEERFGRAATTVLLGTFGVAVFGYCLKVIVEAAIYLYHEAMHSPLATAREDFASHVIFFAIQILVTLILSIVVWRLFVLRQMRAIKKRLDGYKTEIQRLDDLLEATKAKAAVIPLAKDAFDKMRVASDLLREEIAKHPTLPVRAPTEEK